MATQDLQTGDVFQNFRSEMDRLFNQFAGMSPWRNLQQQTGQTTSLTPPAEVIEEDSAYRIITELPGIDQKDVDVTVVGSTLTIRAERRSEQEQKGRNYLMRERAYGTVRREFRLPDDVDQSRIAAEVRNGVLTLTLPRSQDSRNPRRRIEIKSS